MSPLDDEIQIRGPLVYIKTMRELLTIRQTFVSVNSLTRAA